jgi:hypothetical protein
MTEDRKQLKKNYQQGSRPMGVFLIRNNLNDKIFVVAGLDLHGIINRHKFQLTNGSHVNRQLQADWDQLGSDNFAFEIVDELKVCEDPGLDARQELESLEDLWLDRLKPFGEGGYNEPKLNRAERLRRIAKKEN